MARQLSFANGLTLEGEKEWAKSNGVWGDLEDYELTDYTVNGKDDYVLHCELVTSDETKDTGKYVIISHGYNSNRNGAAKDRECDRLRGELDKARNEREMYRECFGKSVDKADEIRAIMAGMGMK